jgi:hypothetical protein
VGFWNGIEERAEKGGKSDDRGQTAEDRKQLAASRQLIRKFEN